MAGRKATKITFRYLWHRLAKLGKCDAWGGGEQKRVYEEWVLAGRPTPMGAFILTSANWSPGQAKGRRRAKTAPKRGDKVD